MATGKTKANKPKKSEKAALSYKVLEGMDGNPATPAEFDALPSNDGKFFFNPYEDATEDELDRCLILNYIHHRLRSNMARYIPANLNVGESLEVLHTEEFHGSQINVCVHYPAEGVSEKGQCFAVVKLAPNAIGKSGDANGAVREYETSNGDMVEDVIALPNRRWIPRWKYVVKTLRARMEHDFDRYGIEREYESESEAGGGQDIGVSHGSQEVIEDTHEVFQGSVGQIIGPKGSKIKEIKNASSVISIDTPKKSKDGPRLKARDLVLVSIKGTRHNINQAKKLIQVVVDEWANQPRKSRGDSGPSGPSGYAGYGVENKNFTEVVAADGGWDNPAGGSSAETRDWEDPSTSTNKQSDSWA